MCTDNEVIRIIDTPTRLRSREEIALESRYQSQSRRVKLTRMCTKFATALIIESFFCMKSCKMIGNSALDVKGNT